MSASAPRWAFDPSTLVRRPPVCREAFVSGDELGFVSWLSLPLSFGRCDWDVCRGGADTPARALAMRASAVRRDATVSANETGGYKYIPGGRELQADCPGRTWKDRMLICLSSACSLRPSDRYVSMLFMSLTPTWYLTTFSSIQPCSRELSTTPRRLTPRTSHMDLTTGRLSDCSRQVSSPSWVPRPSAPAALM